MYLWFNINLYVCMYIILYAAFSAPKDISSFYLFISLKVFIFINSRLYTSRTNPLQRCSSSEWRETRDKNARSRRWRFYTSSHQRIQPQVKNKKDILRENTHYKFIQLSTFLFTFIYYFPKLSDFLMESIIQLNGY